MDIYIWEDTKKILSDVKIKNRIIRFILQVGMAPSLLAFLTLWKFNNWLYSKIWGDDANDGD